MQEKEFWNFIQKLNWEKTGDDKAVIEPVVKALIEETIENIYSFEEILAEKLSFLDTLAHAKEIGDYAYTSNDGNFSADGFLYARCVVVANGEELFNRVLNHPENFPKNMEFEAILGIAPEAYQRKTGEKWDYLTKVSFETFSNKSGWTC